MVFQHGDCPITFGGFYETPAGKIVQATNPVYQALPGGRRVVCEVMYITDNPVGGAWDDEGTLIREEANVDVLRAPLEEALQWIPQLGLRDFPNTTNPRLPEEFDLWWDIKLLSELEASIANGDFDPHEARRQSRTHGFQFTPWGEEILIREEARRATWPLFRVLAVEGSHVHVGVWEGRDRPKNGTLIFTRISWEGFQRALLEYKGRGPRIVIEDDLTPALRPALTSVAGESDDQV